MGSPSTLWWTSGESNKQRMAVVQGIKAIFPTGSSTTIGPKTDFATSSKVVRHASPPQRCPFEVWRRNGWHRFNRQSDSSRGPCVSLAWACLDIRRASRTSATGYKFVIAAPGTTSLWRWEFTPRRKTGQNIRTHRNAVGNCVPFFWCALSQSEVRVPNIKRLNTGYQKSLAQSM